MWHPSLWLRHTSPAFAGGLWRGSSHPKFSSPWFSWTSPVYRWGWLSLGGKGTETFRWPCSTACSVALRGPYPGQYGHYPISPVRASVHNLVLFRPAQQAVRDSRNLSELSIVPSTLRGQWERGPYCGLLWLDFSYDLSNGWTSTYQRLVRAPEDGRPLPTRRRFHQRDEEEVREDDPPVASSEFTQ